MLGLFFSGYQKAYHVEVAIELNDSGLPCANMMIQGRSYPIMIDVGFRLPLALYEEVLEPMEKKPYGTESWKNFRARQFHAKTYLIPMVEVGSLVLKKTEVVAKSSRWW